MDVAFFDLFLSMLCGLLLVIGFIGTFVPVIPGVPLAWGGLLAAFFSCYNDISIPWLVITGVVAVGVSVLDNFLPVIMTKRSGGSKASVTGSTIGLIAGFFLGPAGVIFGPFVGALVGELIHSDCNLKQSLKAAWGAFLGFLSGTGIKMVTVLIFVWIFIISF